MDKELASTHTGFDHLGVYATPFTSFCPCAKFLVVAVISFEAGFADLVLLVLMVFVEPLLSLQMVVMRTTPKAAVVS
jgi:hypothetical protein